jgi:hypothetical protein
MDLRRVVTGVIAGAMTVAVVGLGGPSAEAGPRVFSSSLVCATAEFSDPQPAGRGSTSVKLVGPDDRDVRVKFKASHLPASAPVVCALLCATTSGAVRALSTDLVFDSFVPGLFPACGSTTATGHFTFLGRLPFTGAPFNGECLLPIPVMAILDQARDLQAVCAPGFGALAPGATAEAEDED